MTSQPDVLQRSERAGVGLRGEPLRAQPTRINNVVMNSGLRVPLTCELTSAWTREDGIERCFRPSVEHAGRQKISYEIGDSFGTRCETLPRTVPRQGAQKPRIVKWFHQVHAFASGEAVAHRAQHLVEPAVGNARQRPVPTMVASKRSSPFTGQSCLRFLAQPRDLVPRQAR